MVENHLGPIAATYDELQSLPTLGRTQERYFLRPSSAAAVHRAILQSVEVALYNTTDLLNRATADLVRGDLGCASLKMGWIYGFQRILTVLSLTANQAPLTNAKKTIHIGESKPYRLTLEALQRFDHAIVATVPKERLTTVLGSGNLDESTFRVLHLSRIASHEITIWDHALSQIRISAHIGYDNLVCPEIIEAAFQDRSLKGDTYFAQFRALHQIPELVGAVLAAHLRVAIQLLSKRRYEAATLRLRIANLLSAIVSACLRPLIEQLVQADYHRIRENLGMTSGSHSAILHDQLLTTIYEQLAGDVASAARTDRCLPLRRLMEECQTFRVFVHNWRAEHLHLPRNNLGGDRTRSLIGSPDALKAVETMCRAAVERDPLRIGENRGSADVSQSLTAYLSGEASLDRLILRHAGDATKSRFPHVQARIGIFSKTD